MQAADPELLTAADVADLLQVRQRTVYELVRTNRIPHRAVAGKLLFPKAYVDLWVSQLPKLRCGGLALSAPPPVIAGSHDPLLEWSACQSGSGLAAFARGSISGADSVLAGQAVACAVHLIDPATGSYDASIATERLAGLDIAVIEWARRRQGIMVAPGNPLQTRSIADLAKPSLRVAIPGKGSCTAVLLSKLLADAGLGPDSIKRSGRRTLGGAAAALAVAAGDLDAALGIEAVARAQGLEFIPLHWERLDLVVRHAEFFEAPLQALFAFTRTDAFRKQAALLQGYNVARTGAVVLNARA
jgi:excisionase family DNA binding protein